MKNSYFTELAIKYDMTKPFSIYDIPEGKVFGEDLLSLIKSSQYDVMAEFKTNVYDKQNIMVSGNIVVFSLTCFNHKTHKSYFSLNPFFDEIYKPFLHCSVYKIVNAGTLHISFWNDPTKKAI